MAVTLGNGGINPTRGGVVGVENIAEIQAENHTPNPETIAFDGNRVVQIEVGTRKRRQRAVAVLGVVEILPTDKIRVPSGLKSAVAEVQETVENRRRRESKRRVVVVELAQFVAVAVAVVFGGVGIARPVVPIRDKFVEILDFIGTQRGVSLHREPRRSHPRGGQFHAEPITRLDVCREFLADVAHLSRLHELVGVVHIIDIRANVPFRRRELIAQFVVGDALGLRRRIVAVVGEIVALRLAVTRGNRAIDAVSALVPRESGLRVEKVVFFVDVEVVFRVSSVVVVDEFVVVAVGFVVHITKLHIGENLPLRREVVGGFQINVSVEFSGIGIVIFVVYIEVIRVAAIDFGMAEPDEMLPDERIGSVSEIAEVISRKILNRQTADDVPIPILVIHIPNEAVSVLRQPFFSHEIAAFHLLIIDRERRQTEFREFVVGSELVVVAVAVGVVKRGGGRQVRIDVPRGRQNVVALPEIVGGFVPIISVG